MCYRSYSTSSFNVMRFDGNPMCVPVNILLVRACIFQLEIRNTCTITRTWVAYCNSPDIRVNTRYINSIRGTPSWHILRMYLWWSLCTLYLHACQVRVTVGESGLCWRDRSSDTRMLEIQQCKRKTHGFGTFSCFGPHIWNSLPQDRRHCSTLSSFKAKLKTFLFWQYFHPN